MKLLIYTTINTFLEFKVQWFVFISNKSWKIL